MTALRRLWCRLFGHKWERFSIIDFFGDPEITTYVSCSRCQESKP